MNSAIILKRHAGFAAECLDTHRKGKAFVTDLNAYFRSRKSFGSRDRRRIRAMCYSWFRLGFTISGISRTDQILLSYLTLVDDTQFISFCDELPFDLPDDWETIPLESRLDHLSDNYAWSLDTVFPIEGVSSKVDLTAMRHHQLSQPLLWLSVSDKHREDVLKKLKSNDIGVVQLEPAIGVAISTPIQNLLENHEYEIQDYSSQSVLKILEELPFANVWDCTAGSGGKSLFLARNRPDVEVYASDVRPSILQNLVSRFQTHDLSFMIGKIDLESSIGKLSFVRSSGGEEAIESNFFDLIIADVPCTGSGTWNRNPEHVPGFKKIDKRVIARQKRIVDNAWPFLKSGGYLMYITCSIFEDENEKQMESFLFDHKVELIKADYIKGYEHQSDSTYFALMQKL